MSRVTQAIFATAAIAAIAACSTRPKEVAIAPPPPEPTPVPVYVTPPISPINRGLSPAATVWHMRVALNVAALACRGAQEAVIVQRYNALLAKHKTTLAGAESTLEQQYRATGAGWQDRYDDAMTRLYNFFSQAQVREAFCTASAATLTEAERLVPGELQTFAAAVLPTLDAPFAEMLVPRPVIAAAAPAAAPISGAVPLVPLGPVAVPAPVAAPAVTPATAVGTRAAAPVVPAPTAAAPAVATRAPAPAVGMRAAPAGAVGTRAPRIEVDPSVLQD
ncbi:hypothetical protein [Sphingomonas jeddahensis]|uniref:Uncharacterized protein n=1 Tax=Sphingomonas jeddahensis TaxID=1915074 RepID=A0A1V2ESY1_9SPHN|nr:hypothetical protein [Sphingomonas jeddahensis]ONF95700.1 hypothetical protein SPHI_21370 [Sphingomonas jeddahensis]